MNICVAAIEESVVVDIWIAIIDQTVSIRIGFALIRRTITVAIGRPCSDFAAVEQAISIAVGGESECDFAGIEQVIAVAVGSGPTSGKVTVIGKPVAVAVRGSSEDLTGVEHSVTVAVIRSLADIRHTVSVTIGKPGGDITLVREAIAITVRTGSRGDIQIVWRTVAIAIGLTSVGSSVAVEVGCSCGDVTGIWSSVAITVGRSCEDRTNIRRAIVIAVHLARIGLAVAVAVGGTCSDLAVIKDSVAVAVGTTALGDLALVEHSVTIAVLAGSTGEVALVRCAVTVAVERGSSGQVTIIRLTISVTVRLTIIRDQVSIAIWSTRSNLATIEYQVTVAVKLCSCDHFAGVEVAVSVAVETGVCSDLAGVEVAIGIAVEGRVGSNLAAIEILVAVAVECATGDIGEVVNGVSVTVTTGAGASDRADTPQRVAHVTLDLVTVGLAVGRMVILTDVQRTVVVAVVVAGSVQRSISVSVSKHLDGVAVTTEAVTGHRTCRDRTARHVGVNPHTLVAVGDGVAGHVEGVDLPDLECLALAPAVDVHVVDRVVVEGHRIDMVGLDTRPAALVARVCTRREVLVHVREGVAGDRCRRGQRSANLATAQGNSTVVVTDDVVGEDEGGQPHISRATTGIGIKNRPVGDVLEGTTGHRDGADQALSEDSVDSCNALAVEDHAIEGHVGDEATVIHAEQTLTSGSVAVTDRHVAEGHAVDRHRVGGLDTTVEDGRGTGAVDGDSVLGVGIGEDHLCRVSARRHVHRSTGTDRCVSRSHIGEVVDAVGGHAVANEDVGVAGLTFVRGTIAVAVGTGRICDVAAVFLAVAVAVGALGGAVAVYICITAVENPVTVYVRIATVTQPVIVGIGAIGCRVVGTS